MLAARCHLFRRPIIGKPGGGLVYSKAAIALHNYIWITESPVCFLQGPIDGENGAGKSVDGG